MRNPAVGEIFASRGGGYVLVLDNLSTRTAHILNENTGEETDVESIDSFVKFGYWKLVDPYRPRESLKNDSDIDALVTLVQRAKTS